MSFNGTTRRYVNSHFVVDDYQGRSLGELSFGYGRLLYRNYFGFGPPNDPIYDPMGFKEPLEFQGSPRGPSSGRVPIKTMVASYERSRCFGSNEQKKKTELTMKDLSSDETNCVIPPSPTGGCILPKQPDGGQYVLGGCGEPCRLKASDKVPRNSILTYSCNGNYVLSGNTITVCINDEWYNPPTCQKTCSPLESTTIDILCTYQGENVLCNERARPGTRAKLFCKQSYNLPPTNDPVYREIVYLDYGLWDRTLFSCLPERVYLMAILSLQNTVFFPWHAGIDQKIANNRSSTVKMR
ncbi:uncharacterized protein LOC122630704 [Vespula pensylvanica]|uniref:uncharacterized protein LOC122630704 n=1 Tax=Vespula pensylvanica TaxID=30213 RepID=UPI001CB9D8ED|nr:uncharacterized protein LOC122630704 [Vespula pensylvanica]